FGSFDVDSAARKDVIALTRSGTILAYSTDAPACTSGSWPMYHHDLANSGDYRRDARLPGRPYALAIDGNTLSFKAPGDDLMCDTADHYEAVQSNSTITG